MKPETLTLEFAHYDLELATLIAEQAIDAEQEVEQVLYNNGLEFTTAACRNRFSPAQGKKHPIATEIDHDNLESNRVDGDPLWHPERPFTPIKPAQKRPHTGVYQSFKGTIPPIPERFPKRRELGMPSYEHECMQWFHAQMVGYNASCTERSERETVYPRYEAEDWANTRDTNSKKSVVNQQNEGKIATLWRTNRIGKAAIPKVNLDKPLTKTGWFEMNPPPSIDFTDPDQPLLG